MKASALLLKFEKSQGILSWRQKKKKERQKKGNEILLFIKDHSLALLRCDLTHFP